MSTRVLWIGGSSGLAHSYFNAFPAEDSNRTWIAVGVERMKPTWLPSHVTFLTADCTQTKQGKKAGVQSLLERLPRPIHQIVISVRPPLISARNNAQMELYLHSMVVGLEQILVALQDEVQRVVHISSIAAIGHLHRQHLVTERDGFFGEVSSHELTYPYDRFKRATEELVLRLFPASSTASASTIATNLRLGAIFTDSPHCIQCSVLGWQARIGPYLTTPIDANSGRNVAQLLYHLLHAPTNQQSASSPPPLPITATTELLPHLPTPLKPIYYYTRSTPKPVPYGDYLQDYQQAYELVWKIRIPVFVVQGFVMFLHILTILVGPYVPFLQSIDYLCQVTREEHSFDNSLVQQDLIQVLQSKQQQLSLTPRDATDNFCKESVLECFQRRRKYLQSKEGFLDVDTKKYQ